MMSPTSKPCVVDTPLDEEMATLAEDPLLMDPESVTRLDKLKKAVAQQFNTRCNMHEDWDGSDRRLKWYSPYGLSSFTFSVLAILELTLFADNFHIEPSIKIPIQFEAGCLFFQSMATLLADVIYLGKDSVWHQFDRCVATLNVILVLCNSFWLPWADRGVYLVILVSGITLLGTSRYCRINGDIGGVAFWHSVWHLWFPFGIGLWLASRQFPSAHLVILLTAVFIGGSILVTTSVVRFRARMQAASGSINVEMETKELA